MRQAAALLACLLAAFPAQADPAGVAEKLPLPLPGFSGPQGPYPQDVPPAKAEAAPAPTSQCAVTADQLPSDFIKLMGRLEAPTSPVPTGAAPIAGELPQNRPQATGSSRSSGATFDHRVQRGVEVFSGSSRRPAQGMTKENGVTVYRGAASGQRTEGK